MILTEARKKLLAWYDGCARDLPWRRTRDPYAIWVSEIMLQQTRVDTVIPFYERFMARFPSPGILAEAPEDDVLSAWSGLGYYRRARLLHKGARYVVEHHQGEVPRDAQARAKLPGVGRYTAGAIGSIAFDLPEPIVDGNVARVVTRLLGIDTPLGQRVTEQQLWEAAEVLADGPRPGHLNQAVMELGALVCTKAQPDCDQCPIAQYCHARAEDRVDELPVPRPRKAPRAISVVAVVASPPSRPDQRWLCRGEGSLFGGLWGCPMVEGTGANAARALATEHGLQGGQLSDDPVAEVRHVLSHRDMRVQVYALTGARGPQQGATRAVPLDGLSELGTSTLTRKILSAAPG